MKLTVLDGNALNPGDLTWDLFSKYADITVYPRTEENDVVFRIGDSDAVLLNKIRITEEIISKCNNLKYIGVLATGYNVIDTDAVKAAGICATNIPAYSTMAVSQHVFSLITHFTNRVALHSKSVMDGEWIRSPNFCYWKTPLIELCGKTLGIFGFGNIGRQVENIGKAFGMNVIVCPHRPDPSKENSVTFDRLLQESDFITLHAPLTEETYGIINDRTISRMKDGVFIINTARGALVNEKDIRRGLDTKKIGGYACDVLVDEPMAPDCPLLNAPECIITPHIAWAPVETRQRLMTIAFENFEKWLAGSPQNVIC